VYKSHSGRSASSQGPAKSGPASGFAMRQGFSGSRNEWKESPCGAGNRAGGPFAEIMITVMTTAASMAAARIIGHVSRYRLEGRTASHRRHRPRRPRRRPRPRRSSSRANECHRRKHRVKTERARRKEAANAGRFLREEDSAPRRPPEPVYHQHDILSARATSNERKFLRFFMPGRTFKIHFGLPGIAHTMGPPNARLVREMSFRSILKASLARPSRNDDNLTNHCICAIYARISHRPAYIYIYIYIYICVSKLAARLAWAFLKLLFFYCNFYLLFGLPQISLFCRESRNNVRFNRIVSNVKIGKSFREISLIDLRVFNTCTVTIIYLIFFIDKPTYKHLVKFHFYPLKTADFPPLDVISVLLITQHSRKWVD